MGDNTHLTAKLATSSPDTLDHAIRDLQAILSSVSNLNAPLQAAQMLAADAVSVVDLVIDIDDVLDVLDDVFGIIVEALPALSGVPVIGELVDAAEGVFDTIMTLLNDLQRTFDELRSPFVDDAKTFFNDVQRGLTDISDVVTTIGTTVPNALNTVVTLNELLLVAAPLASALDGTAAGQRLTAFLDQLEGVRTDIEKAVSPLQSGLQSAASAATHLEQTFASGLKDLESAVNDHHGALNLARSILEPASDAFRAAEHRIAPLRWLLDALKWLMKHILSPVIHWAIHVLHLDSFFSWIEAKIEGYLGLGNLSSLVQGNLHGDPATRQAVGTTAASGITSNLSTFRDTLAAYQQNHNAGLRDAADALVAALTGGTMTEGKPWVMPPYHPEPSFTFNPTPPTLLVRVQRSRVLQHVAVPVNDLAAPKPAHLWGDPALVPALPEAPSPLPLLPTRPIRVNDDLPGLDVSQLGEPWSNVKALVLTLQSLNAEAEREADIAAVVHDSIEAFARQTALPATYVGVINDLQGVFNDLADAAERTLQCTSIPSLTGVLQALHAAFQKEAQNISDLRQQASQVEAAVVQYVTTFDGANGLLTKYRAVPAPNTLRAALGQYAAWAVTAAHYAQMIDAARSADPSRSAELNQLQGYINQSAAALQTRAANLQVAVLAALQACTTLTASLTTYGQSAQQLLNHSSAISAGVVPSLHGAAHALHTITGILDPLSALLADLHWGQTTPQQETAKLVSDLQSYVDDSVGTFAGATLQHLSDACTNDPFPFATWAQEARQAAQVLSTLDLTRQTQAVLDALSTVDAQLGPAQDTSYSWPVTIHGVQRTVQFHNAFANQEFVTLAVKALADIPEPQPSSPAPGGTV